MKTVSSKHALRLVGSFALGVMLLGMIGQTASAAILFQDDTFATVESDAIQIGSNDAGANNTAIQFGNDATASENGNVQWNISTNRFSVDHPVDVTGNVTATNGFTATGGNVDFSAAAHERMRESSNPNSLAACTTLNEVIVDTTAASIKLCTTTGVAGSAVWTAPSPAVPTGASDPGTCSVGQLFFNTTTTTLEVCTATNTWGTAGPQDFESVYNKDADKTLTTSNGNFSIAAGTGTYNETAAASNITGSGASSTAINLNASNAAGGITGSWGTGGLNFSSSTGAFSVSGTGNSTVNATSGNLNLTTTTSGNVALTATGSGKSVTFADANVTTPIKFSNTATALNATFAAGDGILDALNEFTSTSAGAGASNVGVNNTFTNITGSDVQAALASIDSKIGSSAPNVDTLTFNAQYPNYTIFRDGTNNNGTLVDDYDNSSGNNFQYFGWTSNNATLEDMDVKFRFPLPTDFASVGNFTLKYITGTATAANNKVDVTVSNATDLTTGAPTVCGTSTANASTTWATATITSGTLTTGCTGGTALNAGDIVEVDVKLYDISGATTFARAATAALAYNN